MLVYLHCLTVLVKTEVSCEHRFSGTAIISQQIGNLGSTGQKFSISVTPWPKCLILMTESVNPIEIAWNMENHRPFLMAVYKKACKLNIRFCRSDLNFLPLLKLLLPGHLSQLPGLLSRFYWNPLYPNPSINADDFIGAISTTRISWLVQYRSQKGMSWFKRREAPCLAKSSHS